MVPRIRKHLGTKILGVPPHTTTYEFGVDEAGRGPLAGPVVCAACYLPPGIDVQGVMDSKQITNEEAREEVYRRLTTTEGVLWQVVKAEPALIDKINILQATLAAMRLASIGLCHQLIHQNINNNKILDCHQAMQYSQIEFSSSEEELSSTFSILVDGNKDPFQGHSMTESSGLSLESRAIIGGDATVPCISAASIIAKVSRDRIMNQIHEQYPEYNFLNHKGYGTSTHRALISKYGWIEGIHRTSFNPVKTMVANHVQPRNQKILDIVSHKNDKIKSEMNAPQIDDTISLQEEMDPLDQLSVADLRSKCAALGLDTVVKRDQGPKGTGRIRTVLLERIRQHSSTDPPVLVSSSSSSSNQAKEEPVPQHDAPSSLSSEQYRRSKRHRTSNTTSTEHAMC